MTSTVAVLIPAMITGSAKEFLSATRLVLVTCPSQMQPLESLAQYCEGNICANQDWGITKSVSAIAAD
jgi:hypothetical protein